MMNQWKRHFKQLGAIATGILLLSLLILGSGCGPNRAERFVPLSVTTSRFRFEPGDYWVYERDSDLAIDSVYVTEVEESTFSFESSPNVDDTWEYYRMDFFSTFRNSSYFETLNRNNLRRDGGDSPATREGGKPLYAANGNDWWFIQATGPWQARLVEQHPSLNIGGNSYFGVFEVEIMSSNSWVITERYFIAVGVGIVRFETGLDNPINQNSWNLLRWQVSS